MMSTREINYTYEEKIRDFIKEKKILGKTDFRFSFKIADLEYTDNEAKIDVIFTEAFSKRDYFLIVLSNNSTSQPIPKNLNNFNMGLDFDTDEKGHFKNKQHQKLYYIVSDRNKPNGEKLRRFWDALIQNMQTVKIDEYTGDIEKDYKGFVGKKEFGMYITAINQFKTEVERNISLKMEKHLKKYFGLNDELLAALRKFKITFKTSWQPPKIINKQYLPLELATKLSKILYEKKD